MSNERFDLCVVGGGIVGLATAWQWSRRFPGQRIVVLEKEPAVAQHQSGHNSGVLHSGIYYRPGSLRAVNCRLGKLAMEEFCREYGIPFDLCGKVIVALDEAELPRLRELYDRGVQNEVRCELIDKQRLDELEPHAAGIAAIHVPEAGIVDYPAVCRKLAELIEQAGGEIRTGIRVIGLETRADCVLVRHSGGQLEAARAVTCAGLHSDRVIRSSGTKPQANIVPFRGEYYQLRPEAEFLCRSLIYPLPDPQFPFLGVHFTRMIGGGVECGPNAVLALSREGYRWRNVNLRDLADTLCDTGFLRMAARYWRTGLGEMRRSLSKPAFVAALQRLVPGITEQDLLPAPAGVRAQALGSDGKLLDDFVLQESDRIVHVGNAPSPAATASLNIAKTVIERLESRV